MKKTIDCLLIGHNEIDFAEYEKLAGKMGHTSGAYRDLQLNYIRCNDKPYTAMEIFNLANRETKQYKPVRFGETFSAAIAYLGSYLQRNGLSFDFIHSYQEEKTLLTEKLEKYDILTAAIITTLYVLPLPIIEISEFIKKYNQNVKIIVGGPFVATQVRTQDPASLEYLFKETIRADFFVDSSQGEGALVEIINSLKKNLPINQVKNIYYKKNNTLHSTPVLKEDNRLDHNPVNWDLFAGRTGEYVNVRTAVSCPFSCSFCGFPQHAGIHQTLHVDGIERELNQLDKTGTIKSINFIDDTFNVPVKRFKEILRMMLKNRYPYKWHSYFRCQYADRETVEMMKESGCEGVFLGIESGSEPILKNMNKNSQVDKYLQGIALLKEYRIATFGSFITGFPGETPDTVKDTVKFIKESGLDFYRTQLWYCEPITPIWNEKEKYHIKGQNFEWSHDTMDTQTACDIIDQIFLTIENPTWIPQYNFDFDSMWHLVHQGISLEKVKDFLNAFYRGIKEKLQHPQQKEAGHEVMKQLLGIIRGTPDTETPTPNAPSIIDKYGAGFDY